MKVLFFGYRDAGVECLEYLIAQGESVVGVVVPSDDDGRDSWCRSIRRAATMHGLIVFTPTSLKSAEIIAALSALKPDVIFSCYYSRIISDSILKLARYGAINFHGAILPQYRGCFSGAWSIINDEQESGVIMHYMEREVDEGQIIKIKKVSITNEDTAFSLYAKVSRATVELFIESYPLIKKQGRLDSFAQDHRLARYFDRSLPWSGKIDWNKSSREIYNFVRALNFPPFKPAMTFAGEKRIGVYSVKAVPVAEDSSQALAGEIISASSSGVIVKSGDQGIALEKVMNSDPDVVVNAFELVPNGTLKKGMVLN